jgi:hypothetical protein
VRERPRQLLELPDVGDALRDLQAEILSTIEALKSLSQNSYRNSSLALFATVRVAPNLLKGLEREKGFEPSTSTLARWHSTTELLPQNEPPF